MNKRKPPKRNTQNIEEEKINDRSKSKNRKVWIRKKMEENCYIGQLIKSKKWQ